MICGKRLFKTQREAHDYIRVLQKNRYTVRSSGKLPTRSYFCRDCQAYHLTTEGKSMKKHRARTYSSYEED